MRIAIQASDLDSPRIDGTRVYLLNMLNRFGEIFPSDDFFVFHKKEFNSELVPRAYPNYKIIKKKFPIYWTQTRFAFEIWKGNYDALWMPMQALPFIKRKDLKTTVTIHDLAFKYFPELFPKKDLRRLNFFTDFAVKNSNKIIAVSNSTKNDILKLYPEIKEEKIKVIYHGFDPELFQKKISEEKIEEINTKYQILNTKYILYVGALQPRKNLEVLIEAFDSVKSLPRTVLGSSDLKLVLAGGKAWMWEGIMDRIAHSAYSNDIIVTGTISFSDIVSLYRSAKAFVFPSLYEGFGIPILEAFASKVPVISAKNSSLAEIGGDAVLYFDEKNSEDLASKIKNVLENEDLRKDLIEKGNEQIKKFSWDKCARETIKFIKS
jgi:glycosyltransferase involved in cell wall biosynthesis